MKPTANPPAIRLARHTGIDTLLCFGSHGFGPAMHQGESEDGQDRLPRPITFSARAISGGPEANAPTSSGDWFYEPKYKGCRAMVHTTTGAMFDCGGRSLAIQHQYVEALRSLSKCPFEWLDCVMMDQGHRLGKGSLIVLDVPDAFSPYTCRREDLENQFLILHSDAVPDCDEVYLVPTLRLGNEYARLYEALLRRQNLKFGTALYGGVVAKLADSIYPVQLRSPESVFPSWVEYHWAD